jgi:Protein of unknown function, DUF488
MLKQLNFKNLKQTIMQDPGATFYLVSRGGLNYLNFDQIRKCPALAPSDKLARKFRSGDIKESEFKNRYIHELQNPIAMELLRLIRSEALENDVYLVCKGNYLLDII